MTIFDHENRFSDLAVTLLFNSLNERDAKAVFERELFTQFSTADLFSSTFESSICDLAQLQNYYSIARSGLDLPFASTLAAHGFVSMHMLKKFGNSELIARYRPGFSNGTTIGAISNSEHGTSINLKKMQAQLKHDDGHFQLSFQKPCITNGNVADVLFTTLWHNNNLGIYLLEKDEVQQSPISNQLVGFRTGDTGMVIGRTARADVLSRTLATEKRTIEALRYCFFVERLIVAVMATGIAHGVEDFVLNCSPKSLLNTGGDSKQFLQEKVIKLHMTRIQMTSLIESVINRGPENFMAAESELSILKLMISNELRSAVFGCIEVLGHWALYANGVLPKVLRDVQMCSFFGGTQELQKIGLYSSLIPHSGEKVKAAS